MSCQSSVNSLNTQTSSATTEHSSAVLNRTIIQAPYIDCIKLKSMYTKDSSYLYLYVPARHGHYLLLTQEAEEAFRTC